MKIGSAEELANTVQKTLNRSVLYASMRIVDKVAEFAKAYDQKVLYVLSHHRAYMARYLNDGYRFDRAFVDFLKGTAGCGL